MPILDKTMLKAPGDPATDTSWRALFFPAPERTLPGERTVRVILRTAHGISVRWGRPLSRIGENPVARKIEYLRAAQDNIGALKGYVIDARFDEPYVRESASP